MYRIGWYKDGKWHFLLVETKAEMLEEVADKTTMSDSVRVKVTDREERGKRCTRSKR